MTRAVIEQLPKLRLIASTAFRNASIDVKAAQERHVQVVHTGYSSAPTIELTWALILAGARHIVDESASLRSGGWQRHIGEDLSGRTLGVLGLGNIGTPVAQIGKAFGMRVIAWSQNLTADRAAAAGAELVAKDQLFRQADILTIHMVLSERSRGLVGAAELALMKPTARLVNTRADQSWSKPISLKCCAKERSPARPWTFLIRSRSRATIHSAACQTSWRHRTSATFRAASTSASIRTRSTT